MLYIITKFQAKCKNCILYCQLSIKTKIPCLLLNLNKQAEPILCEIQPQNINRNIE